MEEEGQAPDLRALREAQSLDLATLSSATSLSVAQLRELEEGGSGRFYSESIKQQALRRVLRHLGVESAPAASTDVEPTQEPASPTPPGGVIQGIIRLSQSGDHFEDPRFPVSRPTSLPTSVVWGSAAIVLVIVLVWSYPYDGLESAYSEARSWWNSSSTQTVTVQPNVTVATTPVVTLPALPSPAESQAATPAPAPVAASAPAPVAAPTPAPVTVPAPTPAPAPAPALNPATSTATAQTSPADCDAFKSEPVLVKPISIEKPGQFVYVLAKTPIVFCATDGQGKTTRLELVPGAGRSVYGPAPWVLASAKWGELDLYFQGAKVWIPPGTPPRIRLNEQAVMPSTSQANPAKN